MRERGREREKEREKKKEEPEGRKADAASRCQLITMNDLQEGHPLTDTRVILGRVPCIIGWGHTCD